MSLGVINLLTLSQDGKWLDGESVQVSALGCLPLPPYTFSVTIKTSGCSLVSVASLFSTKEECPFGGLWGFSEDGWSC